MTATMQVRERISRHVPFGLRLWDVAAAAYFADGLEIEVIAPSTKRTTAEANRSGIYYGVDLPGLRGFELGEDGDAAARMAAQRPYRVELRDPADRFLPLTFDADLPVSDLFNWRDRMASPPPPIIPPTIVGSLLGPMVGCVPIFSAPSRPAPEGLAVLRAQLLEFGTERSASWCVLTASIDATACGIGLADQEGRILILFPYPPRPRPTLTSPPAATNDFRWSVELKAYYLPRPPGAAPPAIPKLADVVAQLDAPRTLFQSTASPPAALPALSLDYQLPLTVHTNVTPAGPSSFLYVNPV